jgi:hypothetical protein
VVGRFWKPRVGQQLELDLTMLSISFCHLPPVGVRQDKERGVNPRKGWRSVINPPPPPSWPPERNY